MIGDLFLIGDDGAELDARIVTGTVDEMASSVPVNIRPGGAQVITAEARDASDSVRSGWAKVVATGGKLDGVATFEYEEEGRLKTTAGIMSADLTQFATIPLDDNVRAGRYTGYAVANVNNEPITIRALLVSEDGSAAQRIRLTTATLAPHAQKAAFVAQDPAAPIAFRGSLVLIAEEGKTFAVVALVQNRGLFTAIPAIPAKASAID